MKILALTYYGTFARYFSYLEKSILELNSKADFFNVSIYPSAHIYWKKANLHSVLLMNKIRKIEVNRINDIGDYYKDVKIDNVINYHLNILKIERNSEAYYKLKMTAIKYIEYFESIFKQHNFDAFISSGDSRIYSEVPITIAKKYNVKVFYFEQGPYGTTIIDEKGVNANSSFRNIALKNICDRERVTHFINRKRPHKFYKNNYKYYVYKMLDFAFLSPPIKSFFPIELIAEKSFVKLLSRNVKRIINVKSSVNSQKKIPDKSILLILQVPYDVQMINNSPIFNNFYDMVKTLHMNVPTDYNLIVREHPLSIGNYEKRFYKYINENNILIINDIPLNEMINRSEVVVVNNSTTGLEVLTNYKPLVILGDSYYDSQGVAIKVNSSEEIKTKIEEAIVNKIPQHKIDIFLYNLFFEYLFEGHFQDKNLKSGSEIAKYILTKI
jgi:capsular polysaccharide export protein